MSTSCYTGQCVVVFGTASLQQYIFQSNRLKENIGASYLAKHWLGEALVTVTGADATKWKKYEKNPWRDQPENSMAKDKPINVIYIGGGNAALLCENKCIAKKAVKKWSRKVLKNAPGLRVVVGYGEVCEDKSLAEAYRAGLDALNHCEEALPFGSTLHSLPVVRPCISTGLPASESRTEPDEGNQWISQSAASKRDQVSFRGEPGAAQEHIKDKFPSVLEQTERLPKLNRFAIKLDEELGGRKGESHIAVVHADGNGMGDLLNQVIDKEDQRDNEFLHNLRAFSASTSYLSHKALEDTLLYFKDFLPLKKSLNNPDYIFPLRPIVFGGDDLTFVCDGRVGLHLTAYYLQQFANGKINFCGDKISVDACAGVAIVHTKFPFARAYSFADDLCGKAKLHRRYEANLKGSWLEFQIIQEGATRSITDLRETQYHTGKGQILPQRPYEVPTAWEDFVKLLQKFKTEWPRSRAKGLLQVLTQGPTATKHFVSGAKWNEDGIPSVENTPDIVCTTGWTSETPGATTPYFDPLEALDFYLEELFPKEKDNNKKENGE
ncbi:MAG: hypothetical protein OXU23_09975 [Candidatus Poribacteria bacterium]|nr:hypothetical protein [Candidatus Poribacteria bacterium]MDE0469871.1 hypothetical protein [Candidatus Poribacteria bacterium]